MSFPDIVHIFEKDDASSALLFCHRNADPDALCSAYAFSQLLKRTRPKLKVQIASPHGLSRLSQQIRRGIPIQVVDSPRIEEADVLVLLDTNTLEQLDHWKAGVEESKAPLIVIDHHAPHPQTEHAADLLITDEDASATCEIIFTLFQQACVRLREEEALALLLGIIYDTKHFTLATSKTFQILEGLTGTGVKVEEALSLLTVPLESSERIARLKAAKRLRLVKLGEWLAAVSTVSSYQASVARALLSLGAHVTVVGGRREGGVVISMRALTLFHEGTGIHLGRDIAQPLGEHLQGMGGGHSTSAGVNGEGKIEDALEECLRLLRKKLANRVVEA